MKCLLGTCVISELAKLKPSKKVIAWIKKNDEGNFYLSSLTFGEIYKCISKLPDSKRRKKLSQWVESDLKERFTGKTLDIDLTVAKTWGKIQGETENAGSPMPAIDSLIAAKGLAYDLTVFTRKIEDMQHSGATLLNPWA